MPECTEEGLPAGLDFRRGALHKLVQAADDLVLNSKGGQRILLLR
jgi:hypothetical protein